jgi:predicted metal-dependent hydrolase
MIRNIVHGRSATTLGDGETVLLPPRYVDYILAHALVHLCEPRHNKRFWTALERVMPDFAMRKQWLAENGGRF